MPVAIPNWKMEEATLSRPTNQDKNVGDFEVRCFQSKAFPIHH
jgi:hypothetical protein